MTLLKHAFESWIVKGAFIIVLALLVALIYYGAVVWLFPESDWGWRADEKRAAFGSAFGALAAVFSGLAFLGVVLMIRQSDRQFRDERLLTNLTELFKLYSSEPMLRAVHGLHLWSEDISKRRNVALDNGTPGSDLVHPDAAEELKSWWKERGFDGDYFKAIHEEYISEVAKFEKLLANHCATADTIHNWRRQVSHFYRYLALLRRHGLLPKELALAYWSRDDRRIIPKVLIPADAHLNRKVAGMPFGKGYPKSELLEFYDESLKRA